ncbi:hypothetical protein EHF33_14275 [Deinococcus psychrotolerans]|uniref:Uncharacterized protein n=1 Tax=Deinococcus psychrotolerans TaxID=2489213 RepID=A0A3G8YQV1_9DEIO|nr:permease prefix domain 1-containing protein [Deinococcus psychrotolerans]AZI44081.1 hypothetical protein EHF33_14275 [Deinococcus psychrotolerans]
MKQTERYLKAATRGLWGRGRHELRTELQGHINERVAEFRLGGLSAEEAERQTLRELGTPERVSSGMLGVHTFPALSKAGALTLLLATTLMTTVPQSLAQVKGIYGSFPNTGESSYLDFEQLKAAIEKSGGELVGKPDNAVITVPGAPRAHYPLSITKWPGTVLVQGNRTYLSTNTLIGGILSSGADLRILGWKNLTLRAGKADIQFETDDQRVVSNLYTSTLIGDIAFRGDGISWGLASNEVAGKALGFTGQFKKGGVYALVLPELTYWTSQGSSNGPQDGYVILNSNVNQAQTGSVAFQVSDVKQPFKLYSNVREFQAALDPYRTIATAPVAYWDAAHPAPALILELSGHFGDDAYTVVNPSAVHIK